MKRGWFWLLDHWPWVSRTRRDIEVAKLREDLDAMRHRHIVEIARTKTEVDRVVRRLCQVTVHRPLLGDRYRVEVEFDARMFHHGMDQKWIAESVGRQVEAEVRASKFVYRGEPHNDGAAWVKR